MLREMLRRGVRRRLRDGSRGVMVLDEVEGRREEEEEEEEEEVLMGMDMGKVEVSLHRRRRRPREVDAREKYV
jgi:hypothetical protein